MDTLSRSVSLSHTLGCELLWAREAASLVTGRCRYSGLQVTENEAWVACTCLPRFHVTKIHRDQRLSALQFAVLN